MSPWSNLLHAPLTTTLALLQNLSKPTTTIPTTINEHLGRFNFCIPGYNGGEAEEGQDAGVGLGHDAFAVGGLAGGVAVATETFATLEGGVEGLIRDEINAATLRRVERQPTC